MKTLKPFTQSADFKSQVVTSLAKSKPRQTTGSIRCNVKDFNEFDLSLDNLNGSVHLNIGAKLVSFDFDCDMDCKIHDDDYVEIKSLQVTSFEPSFATVTEREFDCSAELSSIEKAQSLAKLDKLLDDYLATADLNAALDEARKDYAIY